MKIILLNDVKKQGKKGDILNVKDGFATFLINKGDAKPATSINLDKLDKENKQKAHEEQELIKACEEIRKKIEKLTLQFKVKTGKEDKVFGSVSSKQVADELKLKGYNIDKKQIKLDGTLDTLGYHLIQIELHKKVIAKVKIELVK